MSSVQTQEVSKNFRVSFFFYQDDDDDDDGDDDNGGVEVVVVGCTDERRWIVERGEGGCGIKEY